MEKYTEKIKHFSKVIYILLQIAFVTLIVAGCLTALTWLIRADYIPAVLFKFGNTTVVLPHFPLGSITIGDSAFHFGIAEVARSIASLILIGIAKGIFKKLRIGGSPFRANIVKGLKTLSIALLCMSLFTGLETFLAAGIIWILCIIFDYGCALQNESDTTL